MLKLNTSLPPFLATLNDRQREAALATEGPLIVLAGAGSGKTKMLTSRISYLMQEKRIPGHQIMAVTFTNKAAGEMRERVEKILGIPLHFKSLDWGTFRSDVPSEVPEIGTFHSVCLRILRREIIRTPFTQQFVIYDDSDQLSVIKTVLHTLNIDEKALNPKALQAGINRAKCDAKEPHELEEAPHNFFARQLKRVYEQYQKNLISNNALDFGEIICMTYRLLKDHQDLREKYQRRFRYIHVDEFQDTNRAQYSLLSLLAASSHGGHQNICVVGDEDQSIYKWRGADIRNILDFEKDFPGSRIVKLEQNYRSTKTILAVASEVIRNNQSRREKTLWTENQDGLPVIRTQLADERAEAETVISEIKRLAASAGRAYGEFAIFYRTNAQSRQFEDVLRRENIPYQVVGGLRFYDRKEIKDVLCYFKTILNPSDSVSLKRIINVPARGIGKTTLEKIDQIFLESNLTGKMSYWQVVERVATDSSLTSAATSRKVGQFVRIMKRFMDEHSHLLLSELYHLILDETGYVRDLRAEGTEEGASRVENLEEFNTILQEFEEGRSENRADLLPLFIEQSSLISDVDHLKDAASTVKLMTLHSSKGLEFPVVFMVGMEEGLFPSIKPWEETPEEEIEEERRLCYVGMTRAREQLYLMHVIVRRIWGNVSYQEPSRFFAEVPVEKVEFQSRAGQSSAGMTRHFGGASLGTQDISQSRSQGYSLAQNDWVGRQMLHPEYGRGTVISSEGSGTDQKVSIQFANREQRKFLLRYVMNFFG